MRHLYIVLAFSVGCVVWVGAQSPALNQAASIAKQEVKDKAPEPLQFDKTTHDFGVIPLNGEAIVTFTFTNNADKPVIISAVSSCGCTIPSYTESPVEKGKKGIVKVQYATTQIVGAFNKTVTVTTNLGDSKTYPLVIKGIVDTKPAPAPVAKP